MHVALHSASVLNGNERVCLIICHQEKKVSLKYRRTVSRTGLAKNESFESFDKSRQEKHDNKYICDNYLVVISSNKVQLKQVQESSTIVDLS